MSRQLKKLQRRFPRLQKRLDNIPTKVGEFKKVCYNDSMKSYTYRVIIELDGKAYHGFVPALPGCHTCGDTIEQTRANLRDAISLYLENLNANKSFIPEENSLESFETVIVKRPAHA